MLSSSEYSDCRRAQPETLVFWLGHLEALRFLEKSVPGVLFSLSTRTQFYRAPFWLPKSSSSSYSKSNYTVLHQMFVRSHVCNWNSFAMPMIWPVGFACLWSSLFATLPIAECTFKMIARHSLPASGRQRHQMRWICAGRVLVNGGSWVPQCACVFLQCGWENEVLGSTRHCTDKEEQRELGYCRW